ncbi:hypothetical protein K6H09_005769 [Candida tropicalis]
MADATEDILRRFDCKASSPIKVPNNLSQSYQMADDSSIDLRDYMDRQKSSRNYSDSEYTPSPIKREKPETKQSAHLSTTTRLPPISPKKLFASPTKNYSQHVMQERSAPNSPQKKSLPNENDDLKNLRLEMKRLKQEYNVKIENLNYKLNLITKERDEIMKENIELTSDKSRLKTQNDLLSVDNDNLLKRKFESEKQLKNSEMKILSLEDKVEKLVSLNKSVTVKNMTMKQSLEGIQVKLKKYYDLYKECQEKHNNPQDSPPKVKIATPDPEVETQNKALQPQLQIQELVQALKNLTIAIESKNDIPSSELHYLVKILKELIAKDIFRPSSPNHQTQPVFQSTPQSKVESVNLENVPPESQPSHVSSNSQQNLSDKSRTSISSRDNPSPNVLRAEEPQDFHNANPIQSQPKEWTREREERDGSTGYSIRSDMAEIKEFLKFLVDGVKNDQKDTNSPEESNTDGKEEEEKVHIEDKSCHCKPVSNHAAFCPVCLNREDFTVSHFLSQ